jgi:esterase
LRNRENAIKHAVLVQVFVLTASIPLTALTLNLREYGARDGALAPVVLLHGLFGSSANWHGIARRLAQGRRVLAPDLRNHGRSPHHPRMTYPAMASDLLALLDRQGISEAALVGHSMGGKAAMWLALEAPHRVQALAVADIAPVAYPARFGGLIQTLADLDLDGLADRREADARLASSLPDAALRGYLLQGLAREGGRWHWRTNLTALRSGMKDILGFPDPDGRQYAGPTLFLYGTESDYLTGAHLSVIRRLFPLARLRPLPGAGHWLYAEQPETFLAALRGFLKG